MRFAYLAVLRIFGWLANLVRRHWARPRRGPGRPRTAATVRALVLEMAGQPGLGLPAHPRRAGRPGTQARAVNRMADSEGCGH